MLKVVEYLNLPFVRGYSPSVPCPDCGLNSPKFNKDKCRVWKRKDGSYFYKCFSCGSFGDSIQYYMKVTKKDFLTALTDLEKLR